METQIIIAIISLVGGLFGGWFSYKAKSKDNQANLVKINLDAMQDIIDRTQDQANLLEGKIKELEDKLDSGDSHIIELREENNRLKIQLSSAKQMLTTVAFFSEKLPHHHGEMSADEFRDELIRHHLRILDILDRI